MLLLLLCLLLLLVWSTPSILILLHLLHLLILCLRVQASNARVLTRLVIRIRRLRWLVMNVNTSGSSSTPATRRLFTVTRLWWLHFFLVVVHPILVDFWAATVVDVLHLNDVDVAVTAWVLLLLSGQLLLWIMQTPRSWVLLFCTVVHLRWLFEIILHYVKLMLLVIIMLMMHSLSNLDLLCLVKLHVILFTAILKMLQIIVMIVWVFRALRPLIVHDVQVAALLLRARPCPSVFQLYFDFGDAVLTILGLNLASLLIILCRGWCVGCMLLLLTVMRVLAIASMEVDSIGTLVAALDHLRLVEEVIFSLGTSCRPTRMIHTRAAWMAEKASSSSLIPTTRSLLVVVEVAMVIYSAMLRRAVPVGRPWGDVCMLAELEGYSSAIRFRRVMTLIVGASSCIFRM